MRVKRTFYIAMKQKSNRVPQAAPGAPVKA